MWQEILNIVISNGIFAVLFVLLLSYLLKDSSKREKKYTDVIEELGKNLSQSLDIKDKTDEIESEIETTKTKVDENTHLIKQVHAEVKGVKKDVKEIKKIINKPANTEDKNEKKV